MPTYDLSPDQPVLIGVGTSTADAEAAELMADAARAAAADAGVADVLARLDRIVVPRGTWSYADPGRFVAERVGADAASTVLVDVGIPQQTIIDGVLADLRDGVIDVALVTGGEAKARAARLQRGSTKGDAAGIAAVMTRGSDEAIATETDQGDVTPDVHLHPEGELIDQAELAAGLFAPVEQYALLESALGAEEGRTVAELVAAVAELWEAANVVARTHPEAAFPAPRDAAWLATPSPDNRPLAFPYTKWLVSQWTVDQAVALLLTTAGYAERLGVHPDRWVRPLVGLSSSNAVPVSQRADLHRWPAMQVLAEEAEAHLGEPLSACAHVELYSCFPVAVRIQQRELGLDPTRPWTMTGGMTFGGGPFNSFVLQSLATAVRRLRERGGRALVTSVSGLLTKPGLGVWAAVADGGPPLLLGDLGDRAAAATPRRAVVAGHDGEVTVAAATVTSTGLEPTGLIVLADTPDRSRVIARSDDPRLLARATSGDGLVGARLRCVGNSVIWD